jgi:hypothetical protein
MRSSDEVNCAAQVRAHEMRALRLPMTVHIPVALVRDRTSVPGQGPRRMIPHDLVRKVVQFFGIMRRAGAHSRLPTAVGK